MALRRLCSTCGCARVLVRIALARITRTRHLGLVSSMLTFRERLLATLRAVEAVLEVDGVLVADSEVPNLLEVDAASTLVVSQDVDLAIPVAVHE
jgi:hypothetical protein